MVKMVGSKPFMGKKLKVLGFLKKKTLRTIIILFYKIGIKVMGILKDLQFLV